MVRGVLAIAVFLLGLAMLAMPAAAHGYHDGPSMSASEPVRGHDHANAGHHSHNIGEDTYHQKASHCSLEVAHVQKAVGLTRFAVAYLQIAAKNESVRGITVSPPVPPPLA
jgi:hypothetical protein